MFTGIIEEVAKVTKLEKEQENLHITVECSFANELKVDQSLAHNGVCLTIVDIKNNEYT
ncbi:MAG: riboflavin synthase, partial [Flavobacteriales bacterium]|nr:riboflavin synthase [Flavobacteriales bacterium]